MEILNIMSSRHSVRAFRRQALSDDLAGALERLIATYNAESGLHIQLVKNEPKAFKSFLAHYGKFKNVTNYIALIGRKGPDLQELCGYYGERLVLEAQMLGLNTCWVGLTYKKVNKAFTVDAGEKLVLVIAVGYGETEGVAHKSKEFSEVSKTIGAMPDWYAKGVEAALLAPTAVNQQKFTFELTEDEKVIATAAKAPFSNVDLGIVKLHFELGSGKDSTIWTV